jgi:hypothetical protein
MNKTHINKPIPMLRKSPQPPLSNRGATPDADRARRPPLAEPSATGEELNPGDRVEGSGNAMGYTNVAHYPEGKQGWMEAGLPVEKAA